MNVTDAPALPERIDRAFRTASQATGTPFDYLLATANRESSLDPAAKASTSSATGLFQFIESTWLQLVREEGPKYGLGRAAAAIEQTGTGDYTVADPSTRRAILDLRKDPEVSAVMAGELTRRNSEYLSTTLGRAPTDGELYVAHFLGASGADRLIQTAASDPGKAAAPLFPEQAAANRRIFYERDGTPRSAGEVYQNLTRSHGAAPVEFRSGTQVASADPAAIFGVRRTGGARSSAPALPSRYALGYAASDGPGAVAGPRGRYAIDAASATNPAMPLGRFAPNRAAMILEMLTGETTPPSTAATAMSSEAAVAPLSYAPAEPVAPAFVAPAAPATAVPAATAGDATVPLPRERPFVELPIVETAPVDLDETASVPLPRIRPAPGTEEAPDAPINILKFLGFTRPAAHHG